MGLVKLVIDGKRVIADESQTILEVARQNGIQIPTLCHDDRLEPFGSCFVCVVKVKNARTLLPSCATRVANGMVVETSTEEVLAARKAALELLLSTHFADCLGPCKITCPANIDVQGYIALSALGRYEEAMRLIMERNPLPSTCGRICTRPCEIKGCRRNLLDEPVGIDFIKRFVTDQAEGRGKLIRPDTAQPSGNRIAIVGAGPAGLSAAWYLALMGHKVDIFEARPEAGGMLRYGIPAYRLPKDVLDREIARVLALGVNLKTNAKLGRDFTIKSLKDDGYAAIFLGIGAWASTAMKIEGEDAPNVLSGIDFLEKFGLGRPVNLYGRVLVIGGGNTAIDCARTAVRVGAREVRIVYRRTRNEMPANKSEIHDAEEEGIALDFLVAPVRVVRGCDGRVEGLECVRMELGEPDASGRRSPKPVPGSEFVMKCDFVIAAIGQQTELATLLKTKDFLPPSDSLTLTKWQTLAVEEGTFETSIGGVFAGGDVVTGPATAIEAIAAGRKAAHAIDSYLRTGVARPEPNEFFSRKDVLAKVTKDDLPNQETTRREQMPMLPVEQRINGFDEVELGYSAEQAFTESLRCLECGCSALYTCDLRRYATDYGADQVRYAGEVKRHRIDRTHPFIVLDQNKCILCGRCVRMCSEVVGISAYGYVKRGFVTTIKPALEGSLLDTDCVSCGLCISTCPTGAVVGRSFLTKPGPWKTTSRPTICHYCGMGCELFGESYGDMFVKVSAPPRGLHCRRGFFGYSHVHAKDRLKLARVRKGKGLVEVPVEEGIGNAVRRLKTACTNLSGEEIAVFVSPRLTNEDAYMVQRFARAVLKTNNITSFGQVLNPKLVADHILSTATYDDVETASVIIAAGLDTDADHFVIELRIKDAIRRGARFIYIHHEENRLARVAHVFLRCKPGTQAQVLESLTRVVTSRTTPSDISGMDAMDVEEIASLLQGDLKKVLVFNRDYEGARSSGDIEIYAWSAKALGALLLGLRGAANSQGLADMGISPLYLPGYRQSTDTVALAELGAVFGTDITGIRSGDIVRLLRERRVRVAIIVGEDPFGLTGMPQDLLEGLRAAELLIVADVFETATTREAHIVLPLCLSVETSGTMTNSERRVQGLSRIVPPLNGVETWQLFCRLGAKLGDRTHWRFRSSMDVFQEIRRAVPIYRDIVIGQKGKDIWSASSVTNDGSDKIGEEIKPLPVKGLDCLRRRFDAWFEEEISKARNR